MISLLAEKAVDAFFEHSMITKDDRDLYVYGFFILFSKIIYFIWTVLLGALFGVVVECIVFYVLFSFLREFAGGIHASKEQSCMLWTSVSIMLSVVAIWAGCKCSHTSAFTCLFIVGSVIIVILCPQDSEAKRLSKAERKKYKQKSITCILLIIFGGGLSLLTDQIGLYISCSVCIALECILLLAGKTIIHRSS